MVDISALLTGLLHLRASRQGEIPPYTLYFADKRGSERPKGLPSERLPGLLTSCVTLGKLLSLSELQ